MRPDVLFFLRHAGNLCSRVVGTVFGVASAAIDVEVFVVELQLDSLGKWALAFDQRLTAYADEEPHPEQTRMATPLRCAALHQILEPEVTVHIPASRVPDTGNAM